MLPEPRFVPPVAASYQYTVPVLEVAPRTTDPSPQRSPGVDVVIDGNSNTVAVTAVLGDKIHPLVAFTTSA